MCLSKLACVPSSCADKGTGKQQDIKITGASTLAGDEVDRMVKEAEKYADEDKAKREAVDIKNQVRAAWLLDLSTLTLGAYPWLKWCVVVLLPLP